MQASDWLNSEDFQTSKWESSATPVEDFRSHSLRLLLPAMVSRECETDCGTQSNPVPIHKEERLNAKDELLEKAEQLNLFSQERIRQICSDIYLEDIGKFSTHDGYTNPRTKRYSIIPKIPSSPSTIEIQYCNSLGLRTAILQHPSRQFRNLYAVGIDIFKEHLEIFLSEIADERTSWQKTQRTEVPSHSLFHQRQYRKQH